MSQDRQSPGPEHLPTPYSGAAPNTALGAPGNFGLGLPQGGRVPEPEAEDDSIDLRDIWRLIVKHKWLLISIATVGLLAALLLSFIRTPLYLATATVQVDKRAARVVQFGQEADVSADMDDRTVLGTQLELLKSRVLAERVIDELRLDRQGLPQVLHELRLDRQGLPQVLPSTAAQDANEEGGTVDEGAQNAGWMALAGNMVDKVKQSWNKVLEPATDSAERLSREQVVKAFSDSVKVELVRNTRMIKVNAENASPQLAARIANAVTQAFIALNLERRLESSSYAKTFLETQLGLTKARARAVIGLSKAAHTDPELFSAARSLEVLVEKLGRLEGVGAWTAHYMALRGFGEADAFPAADLGLRKAYGALSGKNPTALELERIAAKWSPWRGYAAQYLWTYGASIENEEKP